eukprot:NODE_216_length_12483_cov_2.137516.p9 type:complete len:145 gc:universal NODE_216_length_12483_cov_2.137516:2456-2022(-)
MRREISCGIVALLKKQDCFQVLIIKQSSGNHWTLCKGHIEESDGGHINTAKRELHEETNLKIKSFLFSQKTFENHYQFRRKNDTIDKTNIFFCGIIEDESKLKVQESEILEYKFLPFDEAINSLTYDTDKDILRNIKLELENKL